MIEKILIMILSGSFLVVFFTRNILVKKRTGQPVRSRNRIVIASIVLTTLCFFVVTFSTYSKQWYHFMGAISFFRHPFISYVGIFLFGVSIISVWIVSEQLKDSWRIGIHEDQKTELIKNGIYAYARNPYFLSYYIMFFSFFLVRPSLVLAALILATIINFHRMILKEETHLLNMHGKEYEQYKKKTGRYLPRLGKG